MDKPTEVVVDTGVANKHSIRNALEYIGCEVKLSQSSEVIVDADQLIFPGVGSFSAGMRNIRERGLVATSQLILDKIRARNPGPRNFYVCEERLVEVLEGQTEPLLVPFINTVGLVIQKDPSKGVLVKTGDTGIWITKTRYRDSAKEFVPKHLPGSMLHYEVDKEIFDLRQRVAELEKLIGRSS